MVLQSVSVSVRLLRTRPRPSSLGSRRHVGSSSSASRAWKEGADGRFETGVSCYDTKRKAVVPLTTKNAGVVTWYACGPTVYDSAHVGHAR
jgi:hypothetical protein